MRTERATEHLSVVGEPAPLPLVRRGTLTLHFAIAPGQAERLKRSGIDALWPDARAIHTNRREVVWDTAALTLGHAGTALVTERQGLTRQQAEHDLTRAPAAGRYQRVTRLPLAGLTPTGLTPASTRIAAAQLMPVFGMEIDATEWRLAVEGSVIEARLSAIATEASGITAKTHLIELALDHGRAQDLYGAARRLRGQVAFGLAPLDRLQAGYRLIDPAFPWPRFEGDLHADMPVRGAVVQIARRLLVDFRAAADLLRVDPDEDAVHQARVSIRRLRSMLSVFGKALPPLPRVVLSGELNAFAKVLAEVRDADVWLDQTLAPLGRAVGPDPVVAALAEAAKEKRRAGVAAIADYLATPRFLELELELGQWFDADVWPSIGAAESAVLAQPFLPFARALLERRHKRVAKAGIDLQALDPEALHEVRILAKKLRYAAEFLRPLFSQQRASRYVDALKQVQEVLGSANDAAVSTSRLSAHLFNQQGGFDAPALARATGLVTGWSAAEAHAARQQLAQLWRAFVKTPRFWK